MRGPRGCGSALSWCSRNGGQSLDQGGCLAQEGTFVGGELTQALGQPGVAASPVGEEDLATLLGDVDQDLPAVALVGPPDGVPLVDEAVHGARHRRRLDPLAPGEGTDRALTLAEEDAQRAQRRDAERV